MWTPLTLPPDTCFMSLSFTTSHMLRIPSCHLIPCHVILTSLQPSEVQVWKDVDGVLTSDPRTGTPYLSCHVTSRSPVLSSLPYIRDPEAAFYAVRVKGLTP